MDDADVSYEAPYSALPWVWLAITAAGAIGIAIWAIAAQDVSSLPLGGLAVGVIGWRTHMEWAMARHLTLTPEELRWESAIESGSIPLQEITEIRLASFLLVEQADGPTIRAYQGPGLVAFVAQLNDARPGVDRQS